MGLAKLEWHELRDDEWIARIQYTNGKYRRYAHVNIFDYTLMPRADGKVPLHFQFYNKWHDTTWHEDIEAAKIHAEAIFALEDND